MATSSSSADKGKQCATTLTNIREAIANERKWEPEGAATTSDHLLWVELMSHLLVRLSC